jgi:hypothetical protein
MLKFLLTMPALAFLAGGLTIASVEPAAAVVYCKTVGVPKGCVARPGAAVGAPVARRAVATPGVGAAGVGVRPGTPMNRGGPVNRAGRR